MVTTAQAQHHDRIVHEMRQAGVTQRGIQSAEGRYLPFIIHPEEHIGAIVYGRSNGDFVMMIATNRRVIFLDKKPMFANMDELTYDVVSGVKCNDLGFFSGVTLHTRIQDYKVNWVNEHCARQFVRYIENRRLEHLNGDRNYNY